MLLSASPLLSAAAEELLEPVWLLDGGADGAVTQPLSTSETAADSASGQLLAPIDDPWASTDIGSVGIAGSAELVGESIVVRASGSDIYYSDQCHYVYQPLEGDGAIYVRVTSLERTSEYAKAGVMIRESFYTKARTAIVVVSPDHGISFQRRAATDGSPVSTSAGGPQAPYWVALQRCGDVFTASYSPDGQDWTLLGSDTIPMDPSVTIGLAVTSHDNAVLTTATFDAVTVAEAPPWGLHAEYFADTGLTSLAFERTDPCVDFDWAYGSPGNGLGTSDSSVRWTGYVEPRYSETYTFHTLADDGERLWVDGRLLIDEWQGGAATEYTGTIYLEAGRQYPIQMEYFEATGRASVELLWSSPSQAREVVPSSRLTTLGVPALQFQTQSLEQGRLSDDAPAPTSISIEGFAASSLPPSTEFAIQLGIAPDAGWFHFDTRDGLTGVFTDGAAPVYLPAAGWAGARVVGLQPDGLYDVYAKARVAPGDETGIMPAARVVTNLDGDVNGSGTVTALDYAYVRAAILGGSVSWACDANADGRVDSLDLGFVRSRVLNPGGPADGPLELYVSPGGSDAASGTFAEPLATLEGAKAVVRALRSSAGLPRGGIVVWLRGGVYERTATFGLSDVDAGAPDRPVVWRAFPNETVRLVGGTPLDPAWFGTVTDASPVWGRLDPAAQGNLLQVDLAAHGITDYGALMTRGYKLEAPAALEIFFDGKPMDLGRWPNVGFEMTVEAPTSSQFTYSGTRPDRWTAAADVWVHGYWSYDYAEHHNHVAAIDTGTQTITIEGQTQYGVRAGQPWYAYNLLEEIDRPGEWYLDRGTGVLYFWAPGDLEDGDPYVSMLDAPLVHLSDAAYVSFEGINFELGRTDMVVIDGGDHNALVNCSLLGAGTDAAVVSGSNVVLDGCEIAWPGRGGVQLTGGDRYSLTPSGNEVRNCDIHDFGRFDFTYNPGIRLQGCGHVVAHNAIHDAAHAAIMYGGNDHLIELNDIYNVCRYAGDAGAIYSGGDWSSQGNILRYNFIHHVYSGLYPDDTGTVNAIYIDDCDSGDTVFGNVIYEVAYIATFNASGRDNIFENNVIAHAHVGNQSDLRGTLINDNPGSSMNMLEKIGEFNYQDPPWSTAYPDLAAIPNDYAQIDAYRGPGGSVFSRNLVWDTTYLTRENTYWGAGAFGWYEEIADNVYGQDPRFVDEATLNLNLAPDSPAWDIPGFQPIPFDDIGIEPDATRRSPADGARTDLRPTLAWADVQGAVSYDVYRGADEAEVASGDPTSPSFRGNVTATSFTPATDLADGLTHYWRVDAVRGQDTIHGEVRSFVPSGWSDHSIGDVGLLGSVVGRDGTFTLTAGGADLWGSSDSFHYVYRELSGDGEIVARVVSVEGAHEHAKAGVMIRETLDADSAYADVILHANGLVAFQRRAAAGAATSSTEASTVSAPYWVKLVREGSLFTAYASPDDQAWTFVGSATIPMASSVFIGLAATAHHNGTLATATFDQVIVAHGVAAAAVASSDIARLQALHASSTAVRTPTLDRDGDGDVDRDDVLAGLDDPA